MGHMIWNYESYIADNLQFQDIGVMRLKKKKQRILVNLKQLIICLGLGGWRILSHSSSYGFIWVPYLTYRDDVD